MARSLAVLVDQQARRWQLQRDEYRSERPRPVVTVARQHGAGGREVVKTLAAELGLDVFDREIVHEIAESTHLSERVVSTLDDKSRAWLSDWLEGVASRDFLSSSEFRYQLMRVVGTIAHHGGAIILGHGAHLVLGAGALRVNVVAPLEARVATLVRSEKLDEREARRQIQRVDAGRNAFVMQHFHVELDDPTRFDVVVNTETLGIAGSVAVIRAAVEHRFALRSVETR
jgi:cytidylate kinase